MPKTNLALTKAGGAHGACHRDSCALVAFGLKIRFAEDIAEELGLSAVSAGVPHAVGSTLEPGSTSCGSVLGKWHPPFDAEWWLWVANGGEFS
eukprot:Skav234545  [mRNA]  locus=scaffold2556:277858:279149:- [translate_table: standard]